jgi:predicted acylesterase/phospholipase RssA
MTKSFAFLATMAAMASQAFADKCYAVAFSSGDQTAAYQAGAFKALVEGHPGEASYTAVSGVSAGAVNAAILASFPVGSEADAALRMQTFWENSGNTRLWKDWAGGVMEGMFVKGGLYNDKPLYNFLASELADIVPNQRFVDVALANIANGTIDEFYGTDLASGDLLDVMYGSFSYPGFFAPEVAMASDWFDGGMVWDIDVFSAVNKCMETHAQEDIVLDVILADTRHLKQVDASNYVTLQVLKRAAFIIRYTTQLDGLLRAQFAYPNIQWRHIIAPSSDLPETDLPLVSTLNSSHNNRPTLKLRSTLP